MKRPTELIEKAKGFKSTDPIRVLSEYAVSLESPQAECDGVTDDTKSVQAMLDKSKPRKTVSDAVDYFDGVWPEKGQKVLCYTPNHNLNEPYAPNGTKWRCWSDYWSWSHGECYQVCNHEEFEAEVERRKGECQYEDAFGDDCEILIGKEDDIGRIIIRRNNGQYAIVAKSSVKKRKPPITHKEIIEMMERAAFVNWTVADFMQRIHDDFELVD